jgi:hypothetical protein
MAAKVVAAIVSVILHSCCAATGTTTTTTFLACDVAVVGGGWAGVYFAFRSVGNGRTVCLFEASDRIGGRTYSHNFTAGQPGEHFTLDLGAYRFTPDMHLPGDIILKVLGLKTACYEPSCPDPSKGFPPPFHFNYTAAFRRIVDEEGMTKGFMTAIDELIERIVAGGGQIFRNSRIADVEPHEEGGAKLVLADGRVVDAKLVLLNLPRQNLLSLPTLKTKVPARTVKMQECAKFDIPSDLFPAGHTIPLGTSMAKAYAFYQDAWWHTLLNMTTGEFPSGLFQSVNTSVGIPISIDFNDGPVRCASPGKRCRGFLEVFYSPMTAPFFDDLRPDPLHPLGVVADTDDPDGKLHCLHVAIMEVTKPLFDKAKAEQPTVPPSLLTVGVWDRQGHGYTAPTKVYYSASASVPGGPDPLERACGVPGLTEAEYALSVLNPLGSPGKSPSILVANNDWVATNVENLNGDWAQESLLQAERGLRILGVPRPAWLDEAYYNEKVERVVEAMGVRPAIVV